MSVSSGSAFFKETPQPSATVKPSTSANPPRPPRRTVGVRILPDHQMSIADSYLYTFSSQHKGLRLGDLGGLEIGLGPGYTYSIKDLPHVHTGNVYNVINGEAYLITE